MHVDVHTVLAGGASDIHADVEAMRRVLFLNEGMGTEKQLEHRRLLRGVHVEEIGHVPSRHDDHVAGC